MRQAAPSTVIFDLVGDPPTRAPAGMLVECLVDFDLVAVRRTTSRLSSQRTDLGAVRARPARLGAGRARQNWSIDLGPQLEAQWPPVPPPSAGVNGPVARRTASGLGRVRASRAAAPQGESSTSRSPSFSEPAPKSSSSSSSSPKSSPTSTESESGRSMSGIVALIEVDSSETPGRHRDRPSRRPIGVPTGDGNRTVRPRCPDFGYPDRYLGGIPGFVVRHRSGIKIMILHRCFDDI